MSERSFSYQKNDIETLNTTVNTTVEKIQAAQAKIKEASVSLQESQQALEATHSQQGEIVTAHALETEATQQGENIGNLLGRAVTDLEQYIAQLNGGAATTSTDTASPKRSPATITREEKRQIEKAEEIGESALKQVDEKYGSGYPLWTPGSNELSYHNGHHGRAVGEAAAKMCAKLELSPVHQALAKATGFAHDLIQEKGRGIDESESAAWMAAAIEKGEAFPSELKEMATLAILGTEPLFNDGKIIGQKATEIDYPSKTAETFSKSVACGDLGGLFTPEGPYQSHQIFKEIHGGEIPFEKITAFQKSQLTLFETYKYPLPEAETILVTHKPQVVNYVTKTLEDLEKGTIESWDDLIKRDIAFMKSQGVQ